MEHQVGHRVGHPFEAQTCIDIGTLADRVVHIVGEGGVHIAQEHLAVRGREGCVAPVVIEDMPARLQHAGCIFGLSIVPREVGSGHLAADDAATAAPTAAASTGESLVVGIVAGADDGKLGMVKETSYHKLARVAVLTAVAHIGVYHPSLLHSALQGEVEHGLLLAVVNSGDARVVALLVVGFQLLNHLGRQILRGHLIVSLEEVLALHQNLAHGLPVDLDVAVVVNLGSRKLLYQFLQRGAFGHTESIRVIYKGIGLHLHLGELGHDLCLGEHLRVLEQ